MAQMVQYRADINLSRPLFPKTSGNGVLLDNSAMVELCGNRIVLLGMTKPWYQMHPKVFVSYSWDDDEHKNWVRGLATELRRDGVDVILDHWHLAPGDQLPKFMETSVRENDFVIMICTPKYKYKSDNRVGGVGYEGDIITAEIYQAGNRRKFIPILRGEDWGLSAPSWLVGSYYIDLRGNTYYSSSYKELVNTIHGRGPVAPPIGIAPPRLDLIFVNSNEFIQQVQVQTPDLDKRFHSKKPYPAKFVRIRVINKTQDIIKACVAYLVGIEREEEGVFKDVFFSNALRLNWELEQGGGLDGAKNIYPNMGKYLDIFFTYKRPRFEGIRFRLFVQHLGFEQLWHQVGKYRLTIRVVAENAETQEIKLIFLWKNKWDDFSVWQETE